jgi:pimeloyl-ACP methyl ester carboxylesterase
LSLAIAGVLVLAAMFFLQDRLLYFPARASVEAMTSGGLKPWPTPEDFRGLLAEPEGDVRGTVIVFHGNGGHAGHRIFYARALAPLGWRVLLAEYPAYGPRPGMVGEDSFVSDAEDTVSLAHGQYGAPVLLLGESLGAAVAAAAAARHAELIAGLLLITPWDRLEHVANYHYPWLPVKWMLRDQYDSVSRLAQLGRPVVVAVAEHDRIVPARFGMALHESLQEPKHLLVIGGAEHNDWPYRVDEPWWRRAIELAVGGSP